MLENSDKNKQSSSSPKKNEAVPNEKKSSTQKGSKNENENSFLETSPTTGKSEKKCDTQDLQNMQTLPIASHPFYPIPVQTIYPANYSTTMAQTQQDPSKQVYMDQIHQVPNQAYPYIQQPHPQVYPTYMGNQPPQSIPDASKTPMFRSGRKRTDPNLQQSENFKGITEKEVRRSFVRKVYLILMAQLIFMFGVISLFIFEPNIKNFVRAHREIYFVSFAIFFGVYIGIACFENLRRKFPTNILLLVVFTIATSYMMGTISSFHDVQEVLMAVGICAAVCLLVTIFSFNTKFDFTSCGGILCILLMVLIIFGIIGIFIRTKLMAIIYASFGAIVFTMYLAYDTQMLMGGKSVELNPEEHVFAAIQIYLDIMYIFMFLLTLIGIGDK